MKGIRAVGLVVLGTLVIPVVLRAQESRCAQVSQGRGEFDVTKRLQTLLAALDPAFGPPRGCWAIGVQALAQTLAEEDQDSAAALWLRWAIRLSPDLQPDTVNFLPRMVTVFRAAREYVSQTRTSGDAVTQTTWLWPPSGTTEGPGRIQLDSATQIPVQVSVDGVGLLGPGASAQVAAGSHEVRASAAGYDSVRVTREVLSGGTTVLSFRLHLVIAQMAPQQAPPPPIPSAVAPQRRKRFPWVVAALGVAGAGTLVAVLSGGKSNPPTGSIIITIPNPP